MTMRTRTGAITCLATFLLVQSMMTPALFSATDRCPAPGPCTCSPRCILEWTHPWVATRGVTGFRISSPLGDVDIDCIVRAICDPVDAPLGQCIEVYECPGDAIGVPPHRWWDFPAGQPVTLVVYAYDTQHQIGQGQAITVEWPDYELLP